MADFIQLGDEGINIQVTVYEDEEETTRFNLSSVSDTTLVMWLGAPDGEIIELTNTTNNVVFATDGSDGVIQYAIETAAVHDPDDGTPVLHISGDWNVQVGWTDGGNSRRSTVTQFEVRANIVSQ